MGKFRWCIIGAGGIADRRGIPALMLDSSHEIVAVMDASEAAAKRVAEKYGVEKWFTDEEEMLKTVHCDAVYIATPVFCHYKQAMLAVKYRKNALIEKPIALSAKEGKEILDAFKAAGLQLSIGYFMGYHNLHLLARDMIKEGKLGQVNLVKMQFSCWYPDIPGAWRQTKALSGGGAIMDLAVHCMELFTAVTGDTMEKYKAFFATKSFQYEVEDSAVILFDVRRILTTCSAACRFHGLVVQNMFFAISEKNRKLVQKLAHMSQRSTREKLISYLSEEAKRHKSDSFTIPFNRQQLADFLSVDRSAMSNELSKMRHDGLLLFEKNRFTLLRILPVLPSTRNASPAVSHTTT